MPEELWSFAIIESASEIVIFLVPRASVLGDLALQLYVVCKTNAETEPSSHAHNHT